jgi:uncharacterized membrane protein YtjA (UPF0391 family)
MRAAANNFRCSGRLLTTEEKMLYWALVFFIVAIVAAIFGFGGIAVAAAGIAKILFFIFLVIFIVSLIMGLSARRGPPI